MVYQIIRDKISKKIIAVNHNCISVNNFPNSTMEEFKDNQAPMGDINQYYTDKIVNQPIPKTFKEEVEDVLKEHNLI